MCEFSKKAQASENQSFPQDDLRFYLPLFNAAGEGMVVVNGKGEIVLLNDRVESLFGYTKEELRGKSISILIPKDLRGAHKKSVGKYFEQPRARMMSQSNNLFGLKKDGDHFPVEVSLNHFLVGEERFAVGVINDVSARKIQEQKIIELNEQLEQKVEERTESLRKSEHLYKTIASNFPDGIIKVLNLDFEHVFAEGRELKNLGLDQSMLLNERYDSTLEVQDSSKIMEELEKAKAGEKRTFEIQSKGAIYQVDAVPLKGSAGEVVQILVIEKNITQKKKADEEIVSALERERELSTLKSRFVSMASHEFRTPLGAILSSVSLISKYTEGDQQSHRDKHIGRIKSSVHNLTTILNDFLSLDKLETGKVRFELEMIDIEEKCLSIADELKTILKRGQQIHMEHEGKTMALIDKHLFGNSLINLISNAVKYSPEEHSIFVNTFVYDDRLELYVRDEGIGIPKEEQKHLFQRFFRANNATNIQGTGLGLNITKKYLELMDGSITFDSEEGRGTTFKVVIPQSIESHE
jgi:PAS domain S-box-containing protein